LGPPACKEAVKDAAYRLDFQPRPVILELSSPR